MISSIARKALMPTLLALAIAPLSLAASADTDKTEHHQQRHAEHREAMQERLTALVDSWELSDEERTTLTEIRESLYQDMRELRAQEFDDRDERRSAYRELRDEHHAALSELLSNEQLEELKAAVKPKRGDHGKRGQRNA